MKTKPFVRCEDITPSDVTEYNPPLRSLFVGTGGNVRIVDPYGNTSNWVMPAGSYLLSECVQVLATGTDGSDIVGGR